MEIIFMIGLVILGVIAGGLSGLIGIGGGIIIIPALIFIFGMSQKMAQGTTLALLIPPIGLLAALTYYKQGYVDIRVAAIIIVGFVIGSLFGARFAVKLPADALSKIFAVTLIIVGIKMLFTK
jgi:uncharacterized membrane protein YfcA